jgi:hypothetical protein
VKPTAARSHVSRTPARGSGWRWLTAGSLLLGILLSQTVAIQPASADTPVATLVRTVALFETSPPSPDPAGITYLPGTDELLISDSEVDEMTIFQQVNLFRTTSSGTQTGTGLTTAYSDEPTGLSFDPVEGRLFVADDVLRRIFVVSAGPDETPGTPDDSIASSFDTAAYGNTDPEDVAFDTDTGDVYVSDGIGTEIYRVSPGTNGVFDGVPPAGDDTTSHFDVGRFGAEDSEGLGYDADRQTLLVLDRNTNTIYETNTLGMLVNAIDLAAAAADHPADVVLAPGSSDPGRMNLYFVTRGEDNDGHPTENDGMLYEMSVDLAPIGNLAPLVGAGPNRSVTMPNQATLTGTVVDDGLPSGTLTTTWSQVSGPATATFASPSALTTSVSFPQEGTYVLRLSADDSAFQSTDDVTVFVAAQGTTILQRPVAASSDDAEEAATGGVNLNSTDLELVVDGSRGAQTVGIRFTGVTIPRVADITGAYVQFQVDRATKVTTALTIQGQAADDPSTFTKTTFGISSRPRTTASVAWSPSAWPAAGAAGVDQRTPDLAPIVQELVNRTGWSSGNAMVLVITGSGKRAAESFNGNTAPVLHVEYGTAGQNQAPASSAGPDQQVTLPSTATMAGAVNDDGLPNSPGTVTATWSLVDGPQSVLIADPSSPTTEVTFDEAGTYVLRLTADDRVLQTTDDVTVTVRPVPGTNVRPLVDAGLDQQIILPNTATMAGSASDDGLPSGTLTTAWSQVSGPDAALFADAGSLSTTVSFPAGGTYVLRLTADDGVLSATDDLTVTVSEASSNLVGNPGFETDLAGWNVTGSGTEVTLARVSGGHSGGWAAQVTNGGSTGATCKLNDQPNWVTTTSAASYTATMWVRADVPGATFSVRLREYVGGTLVGKQVAQAALSTTWQQISVGSTTVAPGSSSLDLQAWIDGAPVGTCFTADDVAIASA